MNHIELALDQTLKAALAALKPRHVRERQRGAHAGSNSVTKWLITGKAPTLDVMATTASSEGLHMGAGHDRRTCGWSCH